MKNLPFVLMALSVLVGVLLSEGVLSGGQTLKVRPPAVAGSFYPADPKELGRMLDGFLAKAAIAPPLENVVALVAPHAGYPYSGPVAAYSYAWLKGRKFDRVVVIAPSHYEAFGFSSVYDGGAYSTPLGQVPVDRVFAQQLAKMDSSIKLSGLGHTPSPDRPEHAIEVQLPFLQRVLGQFQLVPIVVGDQSYDACRALGMSLAKLIQKSNTLIVASSDLSHYHSYDEASRLDRKTLRAIGEYDYFDLARNLELRVWEACGGGPIVAAMIAAEQLGANQAHVLHYANTGDTTGDGGRVVGYGAVALVKTAKAELDEAPFSLSVPEKDALLKIARQSVETAVRGGKPYECSSGGMEALAQERGAFVTITEKGKLRGCIGYVAAAKPLYLTVRDVAMFAALKDDRFRPVAASELDRLQYEISVLSPLRRVLDVQDIRVGQHGLLIHTSRREGLLLPQVATGQKWDRATFLQEVCYKAGLPGRAWQDAGADLFRFTALVFSEHRSAETLTPLDVLANRRARPSPPAPATPVPTTSRF
jgi:AmmeMemoRadiSam system protein B/AmmeMemoRadiSam system protein A